jgi:hypothetical protein
MRGLLWPRLGSGRFASSSSNFRGKPRSNALIGSEDRFAKDGGDDFGCMCVGMR